MNHLSNVRMHMKKVLSLGFVALLLLSMTLVVVATPWDGTPDDNAPAQAIWVDPVNTTSLDIGDTFVVDILVNVTDPDGAGPLIGMFGFQYKLYWNSSVLQAVETQTHTDNIPSGDLLPGWTTVFAAQNETGPGSHNYSVSALVGVAFTGVASLCTYTFQVLWQPEEPAPDWCGLIDIQDDILADDAADAIPHTTVDGGCCVRAKELDTVSPNIVILSPENKTYTTGSVSLSFTVNETTDWIGYSLDGQANVTITGNDTLTSLLDGSHHVVVYANDTSGNMGASSIVYFTVDTTPPDITDVSQTPLEDNVLPEDEVEINATVTDDVSGVKQVTLNYTSGEGTWVTVDMTNLEGNIWNATIPTFPYCTNVTYIVVAEDNAGNTITTEEMESEYGYHVIPEFPSFIILPLFMVAALVALMLAKTVQSGKRRRPFVAIRVREHGLHQHA